MKLEGAERVKSHSVPERGSAQLSCHSRGLKQRGGGGGSPTGSRLGGLQNREIIIRQERKKSATQRLED